MEDDMLIYEDSRNTRGSCLDITLMELAKQLTLRRIFTLEKLKIDMLFRELKRKNDKR
jgi:hypothetical protein